MVNRVLTISFCLLLSFYFINHADAGEKLLEDWNSIPALDAVWGDSTVQDQHIYVEGGRMHHSIRPYSTAGTVDQNLTSVSKFPYSTAASLVALQATIRLNALGNISSTPAIEFAAADFIGIFYNINDTPSSPEGDVYFVTRFGDRGNGLEAWYFLVRIDDPDGASWTQLTSGIFTPPSGGWQMATDYILALAYDGANGFTASIGGQPTDVSPVVGPMRGAPAWWAGKSIRTRVGLDAPFTGDPDAFAIHAVFDNISIDTGGGLALYDDFNSADESLSTSRWDSTTLVRQSEVTDDMLKMRLKVAEVDTVIENGFRYTVGLPPEYQNTDFLQADMKIAGNTMQNAARARVAIGGVFGNGKYSESGHGNDGAIQFNANVEKKVGSADYRVICNAFMEGLTLADEVIIMWEHVPALPDTWYTATLAITGNTLQCQIKNTTSGEVVLSATKDVTTVGISSIAQLGETRELFVRDIYAPAEVIGYYDNIYVKDGKKGDINQDDAVNLTDAILALQIVGGLNPAIPRLAFGTDVDGDKKIGLAEAIYALQAAAQLIDRISPAIVAGPTLSGTTAYGHDPLRHHQ